MDENPEVQEKRKENRIKKAKADALDSALFSAKVLSTFAMTDKRMDYVLIIGEYYKNRNGEEKLKRVQVEGSGPMLQRASLGQPVLTAEELSKMKKARSEDVIENISTPLQITDRITPKKISAGVPGSAARQGKLAHQQLQMLRDSEVFPDTSVSRHGQFPMIIFFNYFSKQVSVWLLKLVHRKFG